MNELRMIDNYPDVLTPDEVKTILSIGRNAIYSLLKSGELKSLRIGKLYRIPKKYLMDYLYPCYNSGSNDDWSVSAHERSVI